MQKIKNLSTKDVIAASLREEIISGRMADGEELTQEQLAETLGVSRMPVREALLTLEQEGFAERLPNRHVRVISLSKEQIRETFHILAGMETELAGLVIDKTADCEELLKHCQALEQIEERDDFAAQEKAFHQEILALAGNKYLKAVYSRLLEGYVRYAMDNLGEKPVILDYLQQLTTALQRRDKAAAATVIYDYYDYYAGQF